MDVSLVDDHLDIGVLSRGCCFIVGLDEIFFRWRYLLVGVLSSLALGFGAIVLGAFGRLVDQNVVVLLLLGILSL